MIIVNQLLVSMQCTHVQSLMIKRKETEKEVTFLLCLVRTFLNESENWKEFNGTSIFHQYLYYTPDLKILHQSSETDTNFLWTDIQLSKGQLNK